jgi:thiamine-phosphate pyrophosphorylase
MRDATPSAGSIRQLASAVVESHRPDFCEPATGGVPLADPEAAVDQALDRLPDVGTATWKGAWAGCHALGFIPRDAACLADAWEAAAVRTGAFAPDAWPVDPVDFGLRRRPRDGTFPPHPDFAGLYAVLPDAAWVGRMARAGVPVVQLRFKSNDPDAIAQEVHAAVDAVRGTDAMLYINDHWREAVAAGAYGVHLGQEDLDALPSDTFDRLRDAGLRLGLSTHGYAEMIRAEHVGPSYIALGAVFPTTLKKMETAPQGLARLGAYARLMQAIGTPQVAIGGISKEQMPQVSRTGVGSIAVVRALTASASPETEAKSLQGVFHDSWGVRAGS